MSILKDLGIVNSDTSKTAIIFDCIFPNFLEVEADSPKDYVEKYWTGYREGGNFDNSLNGKLFELIILTLLYREGIVPFYTQAHVTFVPGIDFDVILYKEDQYGHIPYCLSLKTSLRERWKQADLEGEALKNVHRRAKCYLLCLNEHETIRINEKIAAGEANGIDEVIYCLSDRFNDFISELKNATYRRSIQVDVITGKVIG